MQNYINAMGKIITKIIKCRNESTSKCWIWIPCKNM